MKELKLSGSTKGDLLGSMIIWITMILLDRSSELAELLIHCLPVMSLEMRMETKWKLDKLREVHQREGRRGIEDPLVHLLILEILMERCQELKARVCLLIIREEMSEK